jgi:hypothetical protein
MSKQSMDSQGKTYQADYIRSIRMRKTKQKSKGAVGLSIPTTQYSITRGVHTPWPLKHAQNTTSLSTQPTREARPIQDGEHGAFFEKKKLTLWKEEKSTASVGTRACRRCQRSENSCLFASVCCLAALALKAGRTVDAIGT